MSQIICQNLTLGRGGTAIAHNLSFSIDKGDYFCIVGENGSGKSTLMKTLLRLLPPMGGSVLTGERVKPENIGYLPQQTLVQRDFPASVCEIVLSGRLGRCGFRPFYNRDDKRAAAEAMEKTGIGGISRRCYRELSGGQQQRVLLARALCAAREMLFLDEPVSGLDPKMAAEMYKLLWDLNREDGVTIVMVSHDIAAAAACAGKILHMGKNFFCGTKPEYLHSDAWKGFAPACGGMAG